MSELNYINELFKKFIDNSIDKDELFTFLDFIKDPKYKAHIEQLMDAHWEQSEHLRNVGTLPERRNNFVSLYRKIITLIEQREYKYTSGTVRHLPRNKKNLNYAYRIAAVIIIVLGIFSLFKIYFTTKR